MLESATSFQLDKIEWKKSRWYMSIIVPGTVEKILHKYECTLVYNPDHHRKEIAQIERDLKYKEGSLIEAKGMLIDAGAVKDIEGEIENIKLELKGAKEYMKEQVKNNVPYDFFPTVTQSKYKMGKDGMTTILTFQIAGQLVIELEAILDRMRQWNIELKKHP